MNKEEGYRKRFDSTDNFLFAVLFILFTALIILISFYFNSNFTGNVVLTGSGTNEDPFVITDCAQLQAVNDNLNANYFLGNNIDCSDTKNWNSGKGFIPLGSDEMRFVGRFDGNNKVISHLVINSQSTAHVGLFGYVAGNILNLGLYNVTVTSTNAVSVGGLVGTLFGTVSNSYSIGSVNSNSPNSQVGGLVGTCIGTIADSYSAGIASSSSSNSQVGGLVGKSFGMIANSYSVSSVTSSGIVGGLVASNEGGIITNSYWDSGVSGQVISSGGEGRTTAQMKQQATYVGWDFSNTWIIDSSENNGYPQLRSFIFDIRGSFCGDGTCNNNETCSSCSSDCGNCNSGSGGSGGSSGGIVTNLPSSGTPDVTTSEDQTPQTTEDITSPKKSFDYTWIIILICIILGIAILFLLVFFLLYYLNSDSRKIKKIYRLIKEGQEEIRLGGLDNIKLAREKYNQCRTLFANLKKKEAVVYEDLIKFYNQTESASKIV